MNSVTATDTMEITLSYFAASKYDTIFFEDMQARKNRNIKIPAKGKDNKDNNLDSNVPREPFREICASTKENNTFCTTGKRGIMQITINATKTAMIIFFVFSELHKSEISNSGVISFFIKILLR
ncbi:hypothetical protein FACS189494_03940 [Spirochaetia bacterium]|nr:hypothetical protein FACS189494_03940 [Spirochaetia bacterium]